jgi:flavin reductase (DIM6/NTAB) family NADH-FMN oxidoreductase RutF
MFDEALRRFPLGVSVVTVGRGGVENGLTVSWACPVSFEPLQFMIAVDCKHYSTEFLDTNQNFVLNLLKQGQEKVAALFARQAVIDDDKLDKVGTRVSETGGAILTEALCYFDCEVVDRHRYGNHNLYVGQVVAAEILNDGEPMLTTQGMGYIKRQRT